MKSFARKSPFVSVTLGAAVFAMVALAVLVGRSATRPPPAHLGPEPTAAVSNEEKPSTVSPTPPQNAEGPGSRGGVAAAQGAEAPPGRWEADTENTLRVLAQRMEPNAHVTSLKCLAGSCKVEVRHESNEAAGTSLNAFITGAIDILPDSVTEPEFAPGQTRITLSRGSEPRSTAAPANGALPPKPRLDVR